MSRFLATLLLIGLALLPAAPAGAAISQAGEEMRIFFSNDVYGETAPCG